VPKLDAAGGHGTNIVKSTQKITLQAEIERGETVPGKPAITFASCTNAPRGNDSRSHVRPQAIKIVRGL
jgi:hypothetical protein